MYRNGEGVPKDDVKSAKWYRKAAEQGFPMAQHMLDTAKKKDRPILGVHSFHDGVVVFELRGESLLEILPDGNVRSTKENILKLIDWFRQDGNKGMKEQILKLSSISPKRKNSLFNWMIKIQFAQPPVLKLRRGENAKEDD